MPTSTVWVEPEVFLTHGNVTVYHTYKDDDIAQGTDKYSYTTNRASDDEHFDVRHLKVPSVSLLEKHPPYLAADCNPAFATATDELKAEWKRQWADWHKDACAEEQPILVIIMDGIVVGLLAASTEE